MKKLTTNILRGMVDPEMYHAALTYHCDIHDILKKNVEKWNKGLTFLNESDTECGFSRQGDTQEELRAFVEFVNHDIRMYVIQAWMRDLEEDRRNAIIPLLKKGETVKLQHNIEVKWEHFTCHTEIACK